MGPGTCGVGSVGVDCPELSVDASDVGAWTAVEEGGESGAEAGTVAGLD